MTSQVDECLITTWVKSSQNVVIILGALVLFIQFNEIRNKKIGEH